MVILMKLNNKGFAISTALYGLLTLFIIILMIIFQILRGGSNNSKDVSEDIQKQLDSNREQRIEVYKK